MKKALYILLVLVMVAVITLAAGCSKVPEKGDEPGSSGITENESVSEKGDEPGLSSITEDESVPEKEDDPGSSSVIEDENVSEKEDEPGSSSVTEDESVPEKEDESDAPSSEPETGLHFKTGTWATAFGTNYVFYENGKDGKTVNVDKGIGLGFEYELDANGSGVFHMGSSDNMTKVTVEFIDGGDDAAAINWEDGSRTVLMFVTEDISDDFSYNYKMGQITKE